MYQRAGISSALKRRAERMFRKTGLEAHREIFVEACNMITTKNNWSSINLLTTKLGSSKQEEIYFFRLLTICFNLVVQPCPLIHLWIHLKISMTFVVEKSNPSEMSFKKMQLTIQCNLRVRLWLTNLTWCVCPALPLRTPFSLFPQKQVPSTHFLPM